MPVYCEGENIRQVFASLKNHVKTPFRVLICYDLDSDDTLHALSGEACGVDVRFVKNPGRGVHSAIMAGFEAAEADAVLMMPADDDFNPPVLDSMVEKILAGSSVVCADRFMKGGRMIGCPFVKAFLVRSVAKFLRVLAGIPTEDPTNGFRMFSRDFLRTVRIESAAGFAWSLELLTKAHRLGLRIERVPVSWFERRRGKSRFRIAAWMFEYIRWVLYALETAWLGAGPETVPLKQGTAAL